MSHPLPCRISVRQWMFFVCTGLLLGRICISGHKKRNLFPVPFSCCGGLTRTDDLWVMSPTSYQLLHSAMFFFSIAIQRYGLFWGKTNFCPVIFLLFCSVEFFGLFCFRKAVASGQITVCFFAFLLFPFSADLLILCGMR